MTIDGYSPITLGYIATAVILVLLIVPFTRALGMFFVSGIWFIVKKAFSATMSFIHKGGRVVIDAHRVYFRNFLPRGAVIPSVATKTVKRL